MTDALIIKAPFVGNDGRPTIEPGAFYLDGNYALRVNSWNSLVGVVITVRARIIRASDGEIVDSSWDHTPNTNRTKATNDFPLPEGFILNITAFASSGAPLIGQTFMQVQLARGLSGATLLLATMLQDYITSVQALAYPGSPIRASTDGAGLPRSIVGTTPGVGANILETVPTGVRWILRSLSSNLQTSAVAGNRNVQLSAFAGANVKAFSPSGFNQPASINDTYGWAPSLVNATRGDNRAFTMGWPYQLPLLAGETLQSQVVGLDAGDQWQAPIYCVDEYLEAAL